MRLKSIFSQSFGGHVLLTTGVNVTMAIMALVTGSLVARILGPIGRGQLAAIQTWPTVIVLLAALGLPDAVVYFTSRLPLRSGQYLTSASALYLLCALPFAAVGYWLMPVFLMAQPPDIVSAARWYLALFIVLQATQGMLLHPLRGRGDFVTWNLLRLLYMTGWLAAIMVVWLSNRTTPESLAVAYLICCCLLYPFLCCLW